jgi:hypothetical protein
VHSRGAVTERSRGVFLPHGFQSKQSNAGLAPAHRPALGEHRGERH